MNIDLNQALEQLAQAFNTSVDKLYPILIKQAYVSGILDLLFAIGALTILILGVIFLRKYWDEIEDYDADYIVWIVGVIYVIICMIAVPIFVYNGIVALINPEYWALKEILSALKPRN